MRKFVLQERVTTIVAKHFSVNYKNPSHSILTKYFTISISIKSGIWRDKTMVNKLMYISNNDTQFTPSISSISGWNVLALEEQTNQNSIKVLKVVKPTNKTTLS